MEIKPTSKIIQIIGDPDDKMTVLCDDGSIWCYVRLDIGRYEWSCVISFNNKQGGKCKEK